MMRISEAEAFAQYPLGTEVSAKCIIPERTCYTDICFKPIYGRVSCYNNFCSIHNETMELTGARSSEH